MQIMTEKKERQIRNLIDWVRLVLIISFLLWMGILSASAQSVEERIERLEKLMESYEKQQIGKLEIHGIVRGKYEYQPEMDASRFEVRNARLSAEGQLTGRAAYKVEIDLCDESAIKMKDAWVRLLPTSNLSVTIGQQRMPFSIDAHRNPSAQFFANRSFIAKQVGDMRDVGMQMAYHIATGEKRIATLQARLFNGSNLDNQKTAWFTSPSYSAKLLLYPLRNITLCGSVQHQMLAEREAKYTSVDAGAFYSSGKLHLEVEYLRKHYGDDAFDDCNAVDVMGSYRQKIGNKKAFLNALSYLLRYDYMDDHSSGKKGFDSEGKHLIITDAERHRLTGGLTLSVNNDRFPTDLRINYEKYWYPHGGQPKESEQDKLVVELMVRF